MDLITSRNNQKVKAARQLRTRQGRQKSDLFLVEGIAHAGAALEAAAVRPTAPQIESLFYAPDLLTSDFALRLVAEAEASGLAVYPVSAEVMDALAEKENPQGLVAVARRPELHLANFTPVELPWAVALVEPQDPGNLGTVLRTLDAVGASGLLLLGYSVDPYHPSAVRASLGALFWLPVIAASFEDFAAWAHKHAYTLYGTSAHAGRDYTEIESYASPRILLMGSEREGLSAAQAAACTEFLRLPMRGRTTSLNLAVATGVFLYHMLSREGLSDL